MGNVRFREERLKFFETFFYYIGMLERSENNLKEPVFSSYHVCPRIEIRFSGLESNCGRLLSRASTRVVSREIRDPFLIGAGEPA